MGSDPTQRSVPGAADRGPVPELVVLCEGRGEILVGALEVSDCAVVEVPHARADLGREALGPMFSQDMSNQRSRNTVG